MPQPRMIKTETLYLCAFPLTQNSIVSLL